MVEKEFTQTKLDLKKYDHKFICSSLKYSIEKGLEEDLAPPVKSLLDMIVKNGAPKSLDLGKSSKAPLGRSPQKYISPMKMESRNTGYTPRDSIVSNMSSFADDTMMTDMGEFFDQDRIAIYQVVEDLVKITEAHDIMKKSKLWAKTNNLVTPERQQRRGLKLDFIDSDSVQLGAFDSPATGNPFTY